MQLDNLRAVKLCAARFAPFIAHNRPARKLRLMAALGQKRGLTIIKRYFSVNGEAGRSEFFWVSLVINIILVFSFYALRDYLNGVVDNDTSLLLRSVVGIVVVTLSLPTAIRRLHNLRYNRYISLLLFLPPMLNLRNFPALGIDLSAHSTYVILGLSVIGYIVYLGLVLLPSRSEPSRA